MGSVNQIVLVVGALPIIYNKKYKNNYLHAWNVKDVVNVVMLVKNQTCLYRVLYLVHQIVAQRAKQRKKKT